MCVGGCHVIVVSHSQEGFLGPFPLVCGPTSNIKSQSTHIHNTLQWEMKYAVCTLFLNYLGCFAVVLFMHLLSLSFPLSRKTLFFFSHIGISYNTVYFPTFVCSPHSFLTFKPHSIFLRPRNHNSLWKAPTSSWTV